MKFQFLIGTLKTQNPLPRLQEEEEFQFLIGTLKTRCEKTACRLDVSALFQFLIGTLKTL